jgi:hypothetical protein
LRNYFAYLYQRLRAGSRFGLALGLPFAPILKNTS